MSAGVMDKEMQPGQKARRGSSRLVASESKPTLRFPKSGNASKYHAHTRQHHDLHILFMEAGIAWVKARLGDSAIKAKRRHRQPPHPPAACLPPCLVSAFKEAITTRHIERFTAICHCQQQIGPEKTAAALATVLIALLPSHRGIPRAAIAHGYLHAPGHLCLPSGAYAQLFTEMATVSSFSLFRALVAA